MRPLVLGKYSIIWGGNSGWSFVGIECLLMICVHRCCLTPYTQSEKVGVSFGYHAVVCMGISFPCRIVSVSQQTWKRAPTGTAWFAVSPYPTIGVGFLARGAFGFLGRLFRPPTASPPTRRSAWGHVHIGREKDRVGVLALRVAHDHKADRQRLLPATMPQRGARKQPPGLWLTAITPASGSATGYRAG